MRAVAVPIVLAMLLVGCVSAAPTADQQSAPAPRATLVGWQRPLVRIATEARRGLGDPHVATVDVYSTTTRAFTRASNEAVPSGPDQDVYVLVLHGHFTCGLCSRPSGIPAQRGTMAALMLERHTLRLLEFGFGGRLDVRLLGRVQTLALP
jgi:hypothetical protein